MAMLAEYGKTPHFCNYCPGICCYRLVGSTLYLTATDINRIARHFGLTDGEVRRRFLEGKNTFKVKADGSCVFLLDDRLSKRCSIHSARPQQCRDFPYGESCPYLEREDLLAAIVPRIEKALRQDRDGDEG
jgi:Fe-S-cluster containining protein